MKKISIVLTGKNDNYGGYFDERIILTTKYNIKKLKEANIETEVIFVEWNPLPNKPLLSEKLTKMFKDIKCYVVDKELHDKIRGPYEYMTFMEFFAKNIGIKRATGDIILCTNADVFYGETVFEYLKENTLENNVIYRAERKDIKFAKLSGLKDKLFLEATFRVNPVGNKPYVDASGDFTLATRDTFNRLNGYDETQRFVKIHKDSRILFQAYELEMDFKLIGDIFHIDHEGSAVGTTGTLSNYRATNGPYRWNYLHNLPYKNPDNWGFSSSDIVEEELANNIIKINMKEDCDLSGYNFMDDSYILENYSREEMDQFNEHYKQYHLNLFRLGR